jgi:hypothetical protein
MAKRRIEGFIRAIQKGILTASLFVVYYVVFGITVVAAFLLNRRLFAFGRRIKTTNWLTATGYESDRENSKMQS